MLRSLSVLIFALLISMWSQAQTFQVLCYHDVLPIGAPSKYADDIGVQRLADHFDWLRDHGYTVVSVNDLLEAKAGRKPLPEKAVLLTFDDAYESFYALAYPLLKAHGYPATLAVVGSWIEAKESVMYGGQKEDRAHFMTAKQIKEVAESGLIEIASHSYDLHRGILGNPQGNEMPAATTRIFDAQSKQYESDADHAARVTADLQRNSDLIEKMTGKRPRTMVWPYGRYSGEVDAIAQRLGMSVSMSLDEGRNRLEDGTVGIRRYYLRDNPLASALKELLQGPEVQSATFVAEPYQYVNPMRIMHVDLDYIYDADPVQQEKNLGLLLDRVKAAGVRAVFLQAYADDDASGVARRLYFPNRHLPVKADLFNRVSWQISTRTGARVFAWLPLTAFVPPEGSPLSAQSVVAADGSKGVGYFRLSPFSAEAREYVAEIYEDLARYAYFAGLLIHDDATLSDQEDASPFALDYYEQKLGLPRDIQVIRQNPEMKQRWSKAKTEHLSWFAGELRQRAEQYRKPLLLARNYYAEPILNPDAEEWFAQSLPDALRRFDWVAIMAMPYMEKAKDPQAWLDRLVEVVKRTPGGTDKVIFELQAKRWSPDEPVPSEELTAWMRNLRIAGIRHFGYYPDDPFNNHPNISVVRQQLSTQRFAQ